jgi:hypothetical protein
MTARQLRPRARSWAAGALLAACMGGYATAQDSMSYSFERGGRIACAVELQLTVGGRTGGQGWLSATVRNHDTEPQNVEVGYDNSYGLRVAAVRRVRLGAGEHARLCIPVPTIGGTTTAIYARCGADLRETWLPLSRGKGGPTVVALLVTDRPEATARTAVLLEEALKESRFAHKASEVVARTPDSLPADWAMLSTFDVVFVDGSAELPAETQEVLRQYAAAGGRLAVESRLPAGPLRQAVERLDGPARLLLGSLAALPHLSMSDEGRRALVPMLDTLDDFAGPVPSSLQLLQAIPGIGAVPTRLFLVLILAFAIVTGPVNFVVLRRKRRPMLLLLTVPALGFGTTALILCYGMFRDGFGIQGIERTFTVLDQRNHAAAAIAARTLFAGLAPGRFTMPPGTLLTCPSAVNYDRESQGQLVFAEDGSLDGSALPSRTPSALATTWHGTARARLRFRADGEELELLSDGGIAPAERSSILVRDHDGAYWTGTGPRLARTTPDAAAALLRKVKADAKLAAAPGQQPPSAARPQRRRPGASTMPAPGPPLLSRTFGDELPPGSYLLRAGAAPWIPDHGLDVSWHRSQHVVLGHLAAEDFVR